MTDTTALDALIEAVEAGGVRTDWMPWVDPMDRTRGILPYKFAGIAEAYHGSLDAAKALHDALLPGWDYRNGRDGDDYHALVFRSGRMDEHADDRQMCPNNPARAWLLATLKAYRASL